MSFTVVAVACASYEKRKFAKDELLEISDVVEHFERFGRCLRFDKLVGLISLKGLVAKFVPFNAEKEMVVIAERPVVMVRQAALFGARQFRCPITFVRVLKLSRVPSRQGGRGRARILLGMVGLPHYRRLPGLLQPWQPRYHQRVVPRPCAAQVRGDRQDGGQRRRRRGGRFRSVRGKVLAHRRDVPRRCRLRPPRPR